MGDSLSVANVVANIDVAKVIEAAASSPLGILALVSIVLGLVALVLFRGSADQFKLAAFFMLICVAVAMLAIAFVREAIRQSAQVDGERSAEPPRGSYSRPEPSPTTIPSPDLSTPASSPGIIAEPQPASTAGRGGDEVIPDQPVCAPKDGWGCFGPLVVHAEDAALQEVVQYRNGSRLVRATMILTVENRSADPISYALINAPITLNLPGGINLSANYRGVSGIAMCPRDGESCITAKPRRFVDLQAGDSPSRFNLTLQGSVLPGVADTIKDVNRGTLLFQLYLTSGAKTGETLAIALIKIPLTNTLR